MDRIPQDDAVSLLEELPLRLDAATLGLSSPTRRPLRWAEQTTVTAEVNVPPAKTRYSSRREETWPYCWSEL
jgi:hypothetical protein